MEKENNTDLAHWYVVYTYSGYENKVKMTLEKMVENRGMQDKIQEIIIPMEEEIEIKSKNGICLWYGKNEDMPIEYFGKIVNSIYSLKGSYEAYIVIEI